MSTTLVKSKLFLDEATLVVMGVDARYNNVNTIPLKTLINSSECFSTLRMAVTLDLSL